MSDVFDKYAYERHVEQHEEEQARLTCRRLWRARYGVYISALGGVAVGVGILAGLGLWAAS